MIYFTIIFVKMSQIVVNSQEDIENQSERGIQLEINNLESEKDLEESYDNYSEDSIKPVDEVNIILSPEVKKKKTRKKRNYKEEILQKGKDCNAEIISINDVPIKKVLGEDILIKRDQTCEYKSSCGTIENKVIRQIVENTGMYSTEIIKLNQKKKFKATCLKNHGCEHPSQSEEIKEKKISTCLKNHGCEHPGQSEEVKEKMKATCLKNHGCENPFQSEEIKEKSKATCKERYGVENPFQSEEVREKFKATCKEKYGYENPFQSEEVKDKIKATCKETYGYENPMQSKEVKEKGKATCLKNHGCEHPGQSEEVKEKMKATCLKNYGCEHPGQSEEVKEKMKATCLDKYGVEHPMQDPDIFEKNQKAQYRKKEHTFKDGTAVYLQGYESIALDILEEQYDYKSDDYINHKLPKSYKYELNGKNPRYTPDIPTPCREDFKEGWIEVKSTYTFKAGIEDNKIIIEKGKAVINAGYHFEIWIFKSDKDLEPYKITSDNGIEEFQKKMCNVLS